MSFWPRPAWNTVCRSKELGGLGIIDIQHQQLALHLTYLQRMLSRNKTGFLVEALQQFVQVQVVIANINIKKVVADVFSLDQQRKQKCFQKALYTGRPPLYHKREHNDATPHRSDAKLRSLGYYQQQRQGRPNWDDATENTASLLASRS
ncbi:hypothetical protein BC943DRAFT_382925 [Umbelopsis sp. AD052]|nr:hypothetical protein BC943DRAFT_382925 [Umbelopsis sp. AD052]